MGTRVGYDRTALCGACEELFIIEEEDFLAGKCFPQYKCVPKPNDVCCGFDPSTCSADPSPGLCEEVVEVVPQNLATGPCCAVNKIRTNSTCLCEEKLNIDPCPYATAAGYQADNCPDTTLYE